MMLAALHPLMVLIINKERIKEIINDKEKIKLVGKNAKEMLGKSWKDIAKETYKLYLKELEKKVL